MFKSRDEIFIGENNSEINVMNWLIGQSHTFPTTIYVRANNRGQIHISRLTEHEKLTTSELKGLSNEILLQRKVNQSSAFDARELTKLTVVIASLDAYCQDIRKQSLRL